MQAAAVPCDGLIVKVRDIIFWMPWPPPWWVWLLAAIVVACAVAVFMVAPAKA